MSPSQTSAFHPRDAQTHSTAVPNAYDSGNAGSDVRPLKGYTRHPRHVRRGRLDTCRAVRRVRVGTLRGFLRFALVSGCRRQLRQWRRYWRSIEGCGVHGSVGEACDGYVSSRLDVLVAAAAVPLCGCCDEFHLLYLMESVRCSFGCPHNCRYLANLIEWQISQRQQFREIFFTTSVKFATSTYSFPLYICRKPFFVT